MVLAIGLLALSVTTLRATEVIQLIRDMEPCGDTPVFCFGEPDECLGLVNAEGKILRQFAMPFDVYSTYSEGLLAVAHPNSDKVGFLDTRGRWAIKPRFESARRFVGSLAAARVDGRWGYIDKSGEWAIPPQYDDLEDFDTDGYGRVWKGAWGSAERRMAVLDREGREVIGPILYDATPFSNGVAWAILEGPCWREAPFDARTAGSRDARLEYGLDRYRTKPLAEDVPRCRWSLIETSGRRVMDETYEEVAAFSDGLAPVRTDVRWGFVSPDGTMQIAPQFLAAKQFSEGLAAVRRIPAIDWEDPASSGWVQSPGSPIARDWGFIDKSGRFVIEPRFTAVESFREGFALVWNPEDPRRFIDLTGSPVLDETIRFASSFCNGISQVVLEMPDDSLVHPIHVGYLNRQGKVVFSWKYTVD